MNKTIEVILSGATLATVLTISHALLRASSTLAPTELTWIARVSSSLFLYAIVFFAYTWLLRHFEISSLYPIYTGLSIVGVAMTGVVYFGENWSFLKITGIIFILTGVWLVSRN